MKAGTVTGQRHYFSLLTLNGGTRKADVACAVTDFVVCVHA